MFTWQTPESPLVIFQIPHRKEPVRNDHPSCSGEVSNNTHITGKAAEMSGGLTFSPHLSATTQHNGLRAETAMRCQLPSTQLDIQDFYKK